MNHADQCICLRHRFILTNTRTRRIVTVLDLHTCIHKGPSWIMAEGSRKKDQGSIGKLSTRLHPQGRVAPKVLFVRSFLGHLDNDHLRKMKKTWAIIMIFVIFWTPWMTITFARWKNQIPKTWQTLIFKSFYVNSCISISLSRLHIPLAKVSILPEEDGGRTHARTDRRTSDFWGLLHKEPLRGNCISYVSGDQCSRKSGARLPEILY